MRIESIDNRPLDEDEKIYKKSYLAGDNSLWDHAMSISEFNSYTEQDIIPFNPETHNYWGRGQGYQGVTIDRVNSLSNVFITLHRRYSYPVLHNHDYIEVIYVARGHCINCFEDYSFEMNEGDVCVMSPSSIHALSCTNDESCIINLMMNREFFDKNFLRFMRGGKILVNYLENTLYKESSSPYILFHTTRDPWLNEIARRLISETDQKPSGYEYSISLLMSEFLLHLVREYEISAVVPDRKTRSQNNLTVAVLGYLSVNYNKATLESTARFLGYSTAYLSRYIHRVTGKTFNSIITEMQMDHAIEMLKNKTTNLTDVALEVGCFDSSHFSKKFKAFFGISPTEYIEKLSAGTKD